MALFDYICSKCGLIERQLITVVNSDNKQGICPDCGGVSKRQLPTITGSTKYEVVDQYTNTKSIPDQKEVMLDRSDEYYWKVEVPKMVASGTYSIETMLEKGWVYYDDKDNLQVKNRAPN
jgi:hypothetical protein